jgi:hypothetical protein
VNVPAVTYNVAPSFAIVGLFWAYHSLRRGVGVVSVRISMSVSLSIHNS